MAQRILQPYQLVNQLWFPTSLLWSYCLYSSISQSAFQWGVAFSFYYIFFAEKETFLNTSIALLWLDEIWKNLRRRFKEKSFACDSKHLIARLLSPLQCPRMTSSREAIPATPPTLNLPSAVAFFHAKSLTAPSVFRCSVDHTVLFFLGFFASKSRSY